MDNSEKKRQAIIKKFNGIYKRGYVPSRNRQEYTYKTASMVNCFGHACFNLDNSELEELGDLKDALYDFLRKFSLKYGNYMDEASKRIREVGLKIEKSSIKEEINSKNQWKIAYYYLYDDFWGSCDAHFMIQEKDGTWSSKLGSKQEVEIFEKLPKVFHDEYELVGIYKITNPYVTLDKDDSTNNKNDGGIEL